MKMEFSDDDVSVLKVWLGMSPDAELKASDLPEMVKRIPIEFSRKEFAMLVGSMAITRMVD